MADRDQYGFKPVTVAPVTPATMLKRPTARQTLNQAQSTQDRTASAPQNPSQRVAPGVQNAQRPLSFSRRPAAPTVSPAAGAARVAPAQPVKAEKQQKPKKTRRFDLLGAIENTLDFIARHIKKIGIVAGVAFVAIYSHSLGVKNEDKRARLNNDPLEELQPLTNHDRKIIAAKNLTKGKTPEMVNGVNTAFAGWESGSISEVTGGADIDTWSNKDGSREDLSSISSGTHAATTGPNQGNTLIYNSENGNSLEKLNYKEKTINTEDQARFSHTVNFNERVSSLDKTPRKPSPTEARLAPPKRTGRTGR